jgi:FkbH-like protein
MPSVDVEIHVLSNFTSHLLITNIKQSLMTEGIRAQVISCDYDQIIQHISSLPKTSSLQRHVFILTRAESFDEDYSVKNSKSSTFIMQQRYEEFLETIESLITEIEGHFHISNLFELGESVFFDAHGFKQIAHKRFAHSLVLQNVLSRNNRLELFDVQSILNLLGLEACWNKSQDLLFRQPLTHELALRLAIKIATRVKQSPFTGIKVIATDADGTLWGGVIGEDSLSEIEFGHDYPGNVFSRYQKFLLNKKIEGVLLVLVSKNNSEDVYEFFKARSDMPLKVEDFVVIDASWATKSSSLESISKKLNIGLDSFLFIDDSNFEIMEVSNALPEVQTLLLDERLENRLSQLGSLGMKWSSGSTLEDATRTEMIRQNIKRNEIAGNEGVDSFIKKLEMHLDIIRIRDKSDFRAPRVLQLINKTNQFNMTCRRFTESDLLTFMETGSIYTGVLSDKYGDYGLIAVALVDFPDEKTAHISNLLVSCRALGRKVEDTFISEVISDLENRGFSKVLASWQENPKNMQTKDFYLSLGFFPESVSTWDMGAQFQIEIRNFEKLITDIAVELKEA